MTRGLLATLSAPSPTPTPRSASVTLSVPAAGPEFPDDLTAEERNAWVQAMSAVEPACYVGQAEGRLLFLWGHQDRLVSAARAADLTARLPDGAEVRWYDAGHALHEQAEADRLNWLDRHLGTHPSAPTLAGH
ncbi:hypothetical protein [Rubrivirga marina]|uniref:Uncharacterized protein n=1 Tax=Rubrivirga marina TaxID=1196024 RepID=A0A271IXK3_9BACT|nr:hypothetical protein [Rubrivirga marina]PAP75976.1 hypothetical protein BSZ37_05735 [Rubrivirga marina]